MEPRAHIPNWGTPFSVSFPLGISPTHSTPQDQHFWSLWLERHVSIGILAACSTHRSETGACLQDKAAWEKRENRKLTHPPKSICFCLLSQFSGSSLPPPIFLSELLTVNSRRARLLWTHTAMAEPESTDPFIFIWMEFKGPAESYRRANQCASPKFPTYSEKHT